MARSAGKASKAQLEPTHDMDMYFMTSSPSKERGMSKSVRLNLEAFKASTLKVKTFFSGSSRSGDEPTRSASLIRRSVAQKPSIGVGCRFSPTTHNEEKKILIFNRVDLSPKPRPRSTEYGLSVDFTRVNTEHEVTRIPWTRTRSMNGISSASANLKCGSKRSNTSSISSLSIRTGQSLSNLDINDPRCTSQFHKHARVTEVEAILGNMRILNGRILEYGYADIMVIPALKDPHRDQEHPMNWSKYWVAIYTEMLVVADIGSFRGKMSEVYTCSQFSTEHLVVPICDITVRRLKGKSLSVGNFLAIGFPSGSVWWVYQNDGKANRWYETIRRNQKTATGLRRKRSVRECHRSKNSDRNATETWRLKSDSLDIASKIITRFRFASVRQADAVSTSSNADLETSEHKSKSIFSFFSRSSTSDRGREAPDSSPGYTGNSLNSSVSSEVCMSSQLLKTMSESRPMFGATLLSQTTEEHPIPALITMCVKEIEKKGLDCSGIYRVPANMNILNALRSRITNGEIPDFETEEMDVNVIASLLKFYLRELPDSLIPQSFFNRLADAMGSNGVKAKVDAVKPVIGSLPTPNYQTLKFILEHLAKISSNSSINMMSAPNLSIIFGPTILRMPEDANGTEVPDYTLQISLTEILIGNKDAIFTNGIRTA